MSDFEDIKIEDDSPQWAKISPQWAKDQRLSSLEFRISRKADDSWIECFSRAYLVCAKTKEEFFGNDGVFIDPELGFITQQKDPPVWSPLNNSFSIEWPKSVVEDPKTRQEIIDFMKKCVSEANKSYKLEKN
jgi:hypothetical protein